MDDNCDGFFRLPMPERLYCYYDGKGVNDVFVFENLLADSFVNFKSADLEEQVLGWGLFINVMEWLQD